MELDEKQKQELEELISKLQKVKGRHTELVTVMIPAGFNKDAVVRQLEAERSTAENIKSKQTRSAVIDSLDTIIRELRQIRQTPKNGLAAFAGNISEKEGQQDIQSWLYEPPKPLNVRLYRCDQVFIIEPLQEMLQVEEVYGLLVMDRREATIGILEGKKINSLRSMSSGVPGKIKAGGQCLSPDTLIMKDNGEIIEIEKAHNPLIILSENFNQETTETTPIVTKWENNKEIFKLTTRYPKMEINASKDHLLFVRTEKGIEEKALGELNKGDYIIMPEKINLNIQEEQEITFTPIIKRKDEMREVNIPKTLSPDLAKIFGYYLGDGSHEIDRISFSEQREEVANYYKNLMEKCFGIEAKIKFREDKRYYQIRVGSRILSQFFKQIFEEKDKTLNQSIPSIVFKSPDSVLASFVSGFFDAEGYVSSSRVAFGINNKLVARQFQLSLLRLGIISSLLEYDNRKNPYSKKTRYTLEVSDIDSIKRFYEKIGFSSKEKQEKLLGLINRRSKVNKVRQIAVNGRDIARILRNSGLNTTQFRCPDFFINKKPLNKEIFKKNILEKIKDPELRRRLELFYLSNLIIVQISDITPMGTQRTIDIETKNHNFIANGLIVHNSAARFERITEGLAKEFFRRVADAMKEIFFDMPKLKGILVGGPIPTKEEFLEYGELVTKLKEKVIAIKDIGYTDEHGLKLLVEASEEDISNQEIIKEKNIVNKFFESLGKHKEKTAYGEERVSLALQRGAAGIVLISKSLSKSKIAEYEAAAANISAEVHIISTETPEGEQFLNLTKGVGAILRFTLE